MEISNTKVAFIEESIFASGLPKLADYNEFDTTLTNIEGAMARATKLGNAPVGSGHDCFLKGIRVQADIKYTQYWSMQFQRYHFADIVSSQSKMHRIIEMGLTEDNTNDYVDPIIIDFINSKIQLYKEYIKKGDRFNAAQIFLTIMANIPMGFMLWMRIDVNYLQLKTIYLQRINGDARRLPYDWGIFCNWCLSLPYFKELCLNGGEGGI